MIKGLHQRKENEDMLCITPWVLEINLEPIRVLCRRVAAGLLLTPCIMLHGGWLFHLRPKEGLKKGQSVVLSPSHHSLDSNWVQFAP